MSNNSSTNDEDDDDDNFLRGIPTATIGSDYDSDDEDTDERRPYDPTDASDPFSRHVDEVPMDVDEYEVNGGKSTRRRKTNRRRKSTKRRKTNRRRKHKGTRKRA